MSNPNAAAVQLWHLDFETYYADDYTLSKMTPEEYVRDPRFEVIGYAVQRDDWPEARWVTGTDEFMRGILRQLPWNRIIVNGHNMSEFDSLILTEWGGVRPLGYQCTLQMARALHGPRDASGKVISNSLSALARRYGLPDKGTAVQDAKGKRRADFSKRELDAYGVYCAHDVDLTRELYHRLRRELPPVEQRLSSLVTSMWAQPALQLDLQLLRTMRDDIAVRKSGLLMQVADMLQVSPELPADERMARTQKLLRSDATLARILDTEFGITPPMKPSKTKKDANGQPVMTYAFAKTDEPMTDMLEDDDEELQALIAARLGVKSTIAESRIERLAGIAERGLLPVPLVYGKTHTHRLAGGGKINLQNMNRVQGVKGSTREGTLIYTPDGYKRKFRHREAPHPKTGKPALQVMCDDKSVYWAKDCRVAGLRDTLMAPAGKRLVVADSSNIELRVCHLLNGQMDTIAKIRAGIDLYCDMGEDLYHYPVTKENERERQHGKVAHLQLQFQSGGGAFRRAARIMGGIKLTQAEADETVVVYRRKHTEIVKGWGRGTECIKAMANGNAMYLDPHGMIRTDHNKLWMPNGMALNFFNLRQYVFEGEDRPVWVYDDKESRKLKHVYGGVIVQGVTQALARTVVMEQMLEIERRIKAWGGRVVLTVHDEVVALVDEDYAEQTLAVMLEVMSTPPAWWLDLPVKAEGGIGVRYADAK